MIQLGKKKNKNKTFFNDPNTKTEFGNDQSFQFLSIYLMWCLGTWFSGRLDSTRLTVGLDGTKGLYQPKWYYVYMIIWISFYIAMHLLCFYRSDYMN